MIFLDDEGVLENIEAHLRRLRSLVRDLENILAGRGPSAALLASSPELDPYWFGTKRLPCLMGGNHGHPDLKSSVIATSEVWVVAREARWARTYSRFYRLGQDLHGKPEQ